MKSYSARAAIARLLAHHSPVHSCAVRCTQLSSAFSAAVDRFVSEGRSGWVTSRAAKLPKAAPSVTLSCIKSASSVAARQRGEETACPFPKAQCRESKRGAWQQSSPMWRMHLEQETGLPVGAQDNAVAFVIQQPVSCARLQRTACSSSVSWGCPAMCANKRTASGVHHVL